MTIKDNSLTMPSLPFGDTWQIVDKSGQCIIFRSFPGRSEERIQFLCKELQKHHFIYGIASCYKVPTVEQEIQQYRKEQKQKE